MEVKDLDEVAATDWLYQFASEDAISDDDFEQEIEMDLVEEIARKGPLPYFNERVLTKFEPALDWGEEKGVSPEVIEAMRVGFDPEHIRRSRKGDHKGPAVVLPHFWQGRLVGWQERWFDAPKWIPKYTNTQGFPRKETLYGYERQYFSEQIVVCESVPTVLVLLSNGVPAMSTFGSAVTPEQMRLMRGCLNGLIIAPDNDDPGSKYVDALYEGLERFVPLSLAPRVGKPDSGDDLGDLGHDPSTLIDYIESAEDL